MIRYASNLEICQIMLETSRFNIQTSIFFFSIKYGFEENAFYFHICSHLHNKTKHSYIYIYVAFSRPNGWTDWAEIFCVHSLVAGGCYKLKNRNFFFKFVFFKIFFFKFFFHGPRRALQLVFTTKVITLLKL